jgi:hypothetical protein
MTFLAAVKDPAYVEVITILTTCITNYYTADNNGYLPSHLCTMGLATQLHKIAQAQARAIIPQSYHSGSQFQSNGFNVPIQGTPPHAQHAQTAAGKMAWTDAGIMALIGIRTTVEAPSILGMNAAPAMVATIPASIPPPTHTCKVAPGMATACLVVGGMHDQIRTGAPTNWILCVMHVAKPDTWPIITTCL